MNTHSASLLPPVAAGSLMAVAVKMPRRDGWLEAVRASLGVIALSVLILATLWGALVVQVRREADEAVHNAEVNLANLTRAFSEHAAKALEGADQAIRFVRNEYLDHPKDLDIAGYLSHKQIIGSAYELLSVIGPDGFVSYSSKPFTRVDLRDREHFSIHATRTEDRLFISKPVLGRVSKKWSIQLTRRIDAPDGSFGGVVELSLSPDDLTRLYGEVELGRHGVIHLTGFDGVVRARAARDDQPGLHDLSGSPLFREAMTNKAGAMRATSQIDGIERLYAYRALEPYGLLVFAGMGVDDIMAEPLQHRTAYLISGSVMTLVVLGFAAGLVRRARMQLALVHKLEDSNEKANAANRMKTRFLASVSHELRTPLNGILGYSEMIRDTAGDDESRELGGAIHESAEHLHSLVNMIIDLAKIESGRMELAMSDVPVCALLNEVVAAHQEQADSHGLALWLECAVDESMRIVTDRARLKQVLGQLLDNAIKFSEQHEVRLTAQVVAQDIVFEVIDQGIGIASAQLPALFERFHAITAEFVHPGQGPGLGLPLAHELVGLMGGRLSIRSTVGEGTTASVRIPTTGSRKAQRHE